MTEYDPFADAPEDEAQGDTKVDNSIHVHSVDEALAAKKGMTSSVLAFPPQEDGKVVVTLKGGSGYDAPWIVVHASSAEDAESQLDEKMVSLMAKTKKAARHFSGLGEDSKPAAPARQAAPAPAQQPPAGSPPCPGDGWVYKSGVGKSNGKPWQGWMPPRGSDEKPVFF
ncbi:hypothetical protein MINTMi198_17900 [Mycobacterium intracellulare M.i.198]|uniref:hypothetical protein n=1 Tax=Mycobacterium intracellulare TaxID=1767 RepID=UPI0002FA4109|nr:hypothetical protein [Mycobacterium intracellulare]BCP36420.1 hypothetical protein MINTMi198_17900 [Mycobacterium intracellulare M.i.198]